MPASPPVVDPNADTSNIPPDLPPNFRKWNREHVKAFLGANQEEYGLEDEDIELIYKNNVHGRHFLQLTEEKLVTICKLTFGGAATIVELITPLIKSPQRKFPLSETMAMMSYANTHQTII